MVLRVSRVTIVLAVLLVGWGLVADGSHPACAQGRCRTAPDLFYNYYTPPGPCAVGTRLYVCPLPTPPLVGHTYYTYQPLLPHEFLYQHCRTYTRQHPDGTCTRTLVIWQ